MLEKKYHNIQLPSLRGKVFVTTPTPSLFWWNVSSHSIILGIIFCKIIFVMYFYWQFSRLIEMHIVLKSTYDLFAIFISLVYWNVFTNLLNIWFQNCFPGSTLRITTWKRSRILLHFKICPKRKFALREEELGTT